MRRLINGCIVSGRSWIYGISQHWTTSCMAQIFQRRNRSPYQRTNTIMLRQPSCNIPNNKSSSRTLNETHRHSTSLHSGTVWRKGRRTISCCWRREPSRPVHQVLASHKSGEIQVQNQIVIDVQFSGSVETEYHEMLFWLETEHSNKELYQIIAQSRPVQVISY